jgi:hypothetical protein
LIPVAEPDVLHGNEAVALWVAFAAEDDASAISAEASHTFTVETGLALWADHLLVDTPRRRVAAISGTGITIVATDVSVNTTRCRVAAILCAGVVVIATNPPVDAPGRRVATVIRAGVAVIAVDWRVGAASYRVTGIGGASVVVVAIHRLRPARAPTADGSVAGVTGADVAARSAVVHVGLQVDVHRVAVRQVRGNSARGDLNEHEWIRGRPGVVADADLFFCLLDLVSIVLLATLLLGTALVSLLVRGVLMVAVLPGLRGIGPFPPDQPD